MNTFRIKAYAKINLGLDVLRRRPDGYHEVKMIMQTVDLYDDLEFTKLAEDEIRIFTDKEELPADQGNLIWRAAARMKELYQISEGVSVKLTKRIPIAAGMAGGSAGAKRCPPALAYASATFSSSVRSGAVPRIGS